MLPDDVIAALSSDARIAAVELTGSRAGGQATPLSDWDFAATAARFDSFVSELVHGPLEHVRSRLTFHDPTRLAAPWPSAAAS